MGQSTSSSSKETTVDKNVERVPTFSDVLKEKANRAERERKENVRQFFFDKRLFPNMESSIKLFCEQTLARAQNGQHHFSCTFRYMPPAEDNRVELVKTMLDCADWHQILKDAITNRVDGS